MARHPAVTHVIFDVDGTILDTEHIYTQAKLKVLSRHGAAHLYTRELAARVAGQQAGDAASAVVAATSLAISPAQFTREVDTQLRPLLASTGLKPGARRLVSHLARHGVPAAVATSSRRTNSCVKMSGHRDLFSLFSHAVYGSDDPAVARGKPDPDIFLVAASRFPEAPSPENCLVFEDSVSGVQGALEAGMQVVVHSSTGHWSRAMFDQSLQVVMVPEHGVHPGATEVLPSLEMFDPSKYGLPAYDEEDSVLQDDDNSRDSIY